MTKPADSDQLTTDASIWGRIKAGAVSLAEDFDDYEYDSTVDCDACRGTGINIEGDDCEECDGLGYWEI
jgi:RecJ-like exonuclease